ERVWAGPPHLAEQRRQGWRAAGADQPEAAIRGRPEDEIVVAELPESIGDVIQAKRRDVSADQHRRSGRARGKGTAHALTEIATALSGDRDAARPQPRPETRPVRGDRETQTPAPVP